MAKSRANAYGRYVYYQPNSKDLKDTYGDCQIRAFCKALDMTWVEVFDLVYPVCRELQLMDIFDAPSDVVRKAMMQLGFEYHGVSNKKGSKRPTVDQFAAEHKSGRYIVTVARHVVAVVDGRYYDTWDSGWMSMYGWYELVE